MSLILSCKFVFVELKTDSQKLCFLSKFEYFQFTLLNPKDQLSHKFQTHRHYKPGPSRAAFWRATLWLCCSVPHPRETPPPSQLLASSSHSSPVPCVFVVQFSPVTQPCLTLCDPMDHSTPGGSCPSPSPTPGVYPSSCPLSRWCHPTI